MELKKFSGHGRVLVAVVFHGWMAHVFPRLRVPLLHRLPATPDGTRMDTKMLAILIQRPDPKTEASKIIRAVNPGEGVFDNRRLRGKLALQVRQVEAGTVRSYPVFPSDRFELVPQEPAQASP